MSKLGFLFSALILLGLAACRASGAATPLPLTQTFQSSDGTITLKYPDGWVAQDSLGQITLANVQAAIDAATPAPSQFQARMFATPLSAIQGLQAGATPRDVLQFFANSLSTSSVTFSAPADLTVGSHAAARIEGSGTDGQAIVLAINLENGNYLFVTATSAPGEMPRFEPTLLAILESLAYTPPATVAPQNIKPPVPEATP